MVTDFISNILSFLPAWLAAFLLFGACFVLVASIILLAWYLIRQTLKIRWLQPVSHTIKIHNRGNIDSLFHIFAEAPDNNMAFEYWLDGAELVLTVLPPPEPQQTSQAASAEVVQTETAHAAGSPEDGQPDESPAGAKRKDKLKEDAGKAGKKAKAQSKRALGFGRLIGSMLGTLGTLLPGDLGASLKETSVSMQGRVQSAGQAIEQPEQKIRSVEHLKGQAGSVTSSVTGSKGGKKPPAAANQAAAASQPGGQIAVADAPQAAEPNEITTGAMPAAAAPGLTQYIETGPVAPGESLDVELHLLPNNPYQSSDYTYWLFTQQQVKPDTLEKISPDQVQNEVVPSPKKVVHNFFYKGISLVYGVLTGLLILLVGILSLTLSINAVQWLLGMLPG